MKFHWSISQVVTFAISVSTITAGIVLWAQSSFESKDNAKSKYDSFDSRLKSNEDDIKAIRDSNTKIAVDVSYIRGRLEPKTVNQ